MSGLSEKKGGRDTLQVIALPAWIEVTPDSMRWVKKNGRQLNTHSVLPDRNMLLSGMTAYVEVPYPGHLTINIPPRNAWMDQGF